MPQHNAAKAWLDEKLNGRPQVGLPWTSLLTFVRLTTSSRVFERASDVTTAWQQVQTWLEAPPVWIPLPSERHAEILGPLLKEAGRGGNLVPDAHLAALATEYGLTLCSADGDFARFSGLKWHNPLR